jgi:hypothetical protein
MRWLMLLSLATGCVLRDDVTRVTLRDPSQVAIAGVMAIGSDRGDIPAWAYIGSAETGSWVEREGSARIERSGSAGPRSAPEGERGGRIDAWCPACSIWRRRTIIDGPELSLDGSASELLHFDGDELHIGWVFQAAATCHRRHCLYSKIALDVVTPRANVAAIDYTSKVSPRNGGRTLALTGMIFEIAYAALGAGLIGLGADKHVGGLEIAGAAMIGVSGGMFALEAPAYFAHDLHQSITP